METFPLGHEMGQKMKKKPKGHDHHHMIYDFKGRFLICLVLTIPVIFLTPHIPHFLGINQYIKIPGDSYLLFIISSIIFFYRGYPFFTGM